TVIDRATNSAQSTITIGNTLLTIGSKKRTEAAPAMTDAVDPATVMPICTVARKRFGSSLSAATIRAAADPSATSWATRLWRTATMEISAAAKNPLARINKVI